MKYKDFFSRVLKGAGIGTAMIIPGVSGGTVATLENIYNPLIDSICGIRKEFKKSILFLLPIFIGMILSFVIMYFPLKIALEHCPLPTIFLFAGLMIGSCPKLIRDSISRPVKVIDTVGMVISFFLVIGICFIPGVSNVNLGVGMEAYQYILVLIIGAVASCALVVPGISGSMLLLIFGYYEPILELFSQLKENAGHSVIVLGLFAIGVIVGFFSIAKLIKFLLMRFPSFTKLCLLGFVLASIPAIFIVFDYKNSPIDVLQISISIIMIMIGFSFSFFLIKYSEKKTKDQELLFNEES